MMDPEGGVVASGAVGEGGVPVAGWACFGLRLRHGVPTTTMRRLFMVPSGPG